MDVFDALADPVRRAILRRLAAGPARVVDLAADHPVSRPAISRHLRVLAEAGLVRGEDHGRERHYALDAEPLAGVAELLAALGATGARSPARRPPIPPVPEAALDALETEVRRTTRDRRRRPATPQTRQETA